MADGLHVCLTINGCLQIHSGDERAHHELLAALPLLLCERAERVLILGGGDGLAAREALRFAEVREVVVVDLGRGVIDLCRTHPALRELNRGSLDDPRVRVEVADAFAWLEAATGTFDLIINDIDVLSTPQAPGAGLAAMQALVRRQREHVRDGGWRALYAPLDAEAAAFLGCPPGEVAAALDNTFAPALGARMRTRLSTRHMGPHLYLHGGRDPVPRRPQRPLPPGGAFLNEARVARVLAQGVP